MHSKSAKWICGALLVLGLALQGFAAVCVEIEKDKDSLTEQEQNVSRNFIEALLSEEGLEINNEKCSEKYFVYHLKLGNAVTVIMSNAKKTEKVMAPSMEELSAAYSQAIRKLLGKSGETRGNVTSAQARPNRIKADDLWYIGFGFAMIPDLKVDGVAMNFGYRYELDELAVDFSFNFLIPKQTDQDSTNWDEEEDETAVLDMRIAALYYMAPESSSSFYLGGGLGYGSMTVGTLSSTGLSGTGILGVEFLRASTIRMFVQIAGTMPFYKLDGKMNPYLSGSLNIAF